MDKPRHHTLQGICQDVCVSYRSVVEVHRRIREVVLRENGKVITQNLGTFFCRDVQPRTGVLNGVAWSSDGFFEVGLKGERSERTDAHDEPDVERVSFTIGSGFLGDSVFGDLFSQRGFRLFEFDQESGTIMGTRLGIDVDPEPVGEENADRENVSIQGLVAGFNNVVFEVRESDNVGVINGQLLADAEALIVVNGTRIGLNESAVIDVSGPVEFSIDSSFFDIFRHPSGFAYRLSYTFVNPNEV